MRDDALMIIGLMAIATLALLIILVVGMVGCALGWTWLPLDGMENCVVR